MTSTVPRVTAASVEMWREKAGALATADSILTRLRTSLANDGVVGEARLVQLVYLALTSRYLPTPVSVVVKGPSSAGKSYTTRHVLRRIPDEAYYALSGMSERALAYSSVPLAHRFLVFFEAAGVSGEFASYLLRSLLSEGCIRYETVEKNDDGKLAARLVEREGPTGCLITTTEVSLHPENETRLLSVPVDDSREQTQRILLGHADHHDQPPVDVEDWHALHRWIGAAGECRVLVPFAKGLAARIPPVALRLRRDFPALLSLISAHALLHRATRSVDDTRAVVATVDDYRIVRELVADLMGATADMEVPESVRDAVLAVSTLTSGGAAGLHVSVTQVARHLKVDVSTASRRLKIALGQGFVENQETRSGRPARFVLGDPMPDDMPVLPEVETLSLPTWVTDPAERDDSDPIGQHDEDDVSGCVGTGAGSGVGPGAGPVS